MAACSIRSISRSKEYKISKPWNESYSQTTKHSAGIRADAGIHDPLSQLDRADPALGHVPKSLVVNLGAILAYSVFAPCPSFLPPKLWSIVPQRLDQRLFRGAGS